MCVLGVCALNHLQLGFYYKTPHESVLLLPVSIYENLVSVQVASKLSSTPGRTIKLFKSFLSDFIGQDIFLSNMANSR